MSKRLRSLALSVESWRSWRALSNHLAPKQAGGASSDPLSRDSAGWVLDHVDDDSARRHVPHLALDEPFDERTQFLVRLR